jgi:3-isopropylmalate/(R)-2-methylmalate dehydratase large subunit
VYAETYVLDTRNMEPQVALPHSVGNVRCVSDVGIVPIDQAIIASCCHGRIDDLDIAAGIVRGKKIHPGVRFYVTPASWDVYKEAVKRGIIGTLTESGVMIGSPSCGFCNSFQGAMAAGDTCVAALPRNFKGRMGSPDAAVYLASPATVAASALEGRIVDPREVCP